MTPGEEGTQTSQSAFHVFHEQEACWFWIAKHTTCISHRQSCNFVHPSLCVHLSPWHENKLLKRKQALHDCLKQQLVSWKLLHQPVLLASLEMQWCSAAIWLGLLPRSYLHWPVEPGPLSTGSRWRNCSERVCGWNKLTPDGHSK